MPRGEGMRRLERALFRLLMGLHPRVRRSDYVEEFRVELAHRLRAASSWWGRWAIWVGEATAIVRYRIRHSVRRGGGKSLQLGTGTGGISMDMIVLELKFAIRGLTKAFGFTALSVGTLGVGIGATTLIFSVVYGVLLKPLPYADADRLVSVWVELVHENQNGPTVAPGDFRDYRSWSTSFEAFSAASGDFAAGFSGVLTGNGTPQQVDLSPVTANFFPLLGIEPTLGRHFRAQEEAIDGPRVAMISNDLWESRFGSDPLVVGTRIDIDDTPHEIVGVLPRGFKLLLPAEVFGAKHSDVWLPLRLDYDAQPPRNWTMLTVLGKLNSGVSLAAAQSEMDAIAVRLRAEHSEHEVSGMRVALVPLQQDVVKDARAILLTLFGAVGFVLLIACVNVAHLFLLRGHSRVQEMAVRAALGASRRSVARKVIIESLAIGVLGAGLGLLIATAGLRVITVFEPRNLPRVSELTIDVTVMGFAIAMAVLTSLLFGLFPAVKASLTDVNALLKRGSRTVRSGAAARMRQGLIATEIAVSLVLLIGTGLLVRSFAAVNDVAPGFESEGATTFSLTFPDARYDVAGRKAFASELERRVAGLPGVVAVGGAMRLPLGGRTPSMPYAYDDETRETFSLTAHTNWVTGGYFAALGTRIVEGRTFLESDRVDGGRVVIVGERLAQRAWPGESAIGKQLALARSGGVQDATVIGVVEHVRIGDLRSDGKEQMYNLSPPGGQGGRTISMVVRVDEGSDPLLLSESLRQTVWALDELLAVNDLRVLDAYVADSLAPMRFAMILMSVLGAIALILASVGMYGVISYSLGLRQGEFGVKLAFGASPKELMGSVVLGNIKLILFSIALGFIGSLTLGRVVEGLVFGITVSDPVTYVAIGAILLLTSLAASYVPARRTVAMDPARILRGDDAERG